MIGSSIAHTFARHQYKTILVDKQQPGQEASAAAAGILAVSSGRSKRGPMYQLKKASQALYPGLIQEIQQATGVDVEYQTVGVLCLIRNDTDEKNIVSCMSSDKNRAIQSPGCQPRRSDRRNRP